MVETVVSLTTHAGRAPFVAPSVLSLARQAEAVSAKLCLAVGPEAANLLPKEVKALADEGRVELLVEERDLGVNMKWAPARKRHPSARIVALDDDRIYADSALPGLIAASDERPDAFLCYAYRELAILPDGHTAPYCLKRRFGPKAVLHTGLEYEEPKRLERGMFIAEHWLGCLHPPEFGLREIDEAYKRAPKDDDTFLSVLATRKNVPVYCVPCKESPCVRELDDASFKSTALGNQRHDQWSRTRAVLASYENELVKARVGWERFGLRLLLTCDAYKERYETVRRELARVGLDVEVLRCPHMASEGLTERTCPDERVREILSRLPCIGQASVEFAHRTAMLRFLASPYETMLVIEDDVRFMKDLAKLGSYVKSLPDDFDEARLCWGGARGDAMSGEELAGGKWRRVRRNLGSLYSTAAYAVSRKGAENWLKAFDESMDAPLESDLLVRRYGSSENVYIPNRPCAITVPADKFVSMHDNTALILDVEACGGSADDYEGGAA